MLRSQLIRLGVIIGIALIAIWGIEMVNRPGETVVIIADEDGMGVELVAQMKAERDSLARELKAMKTGERPASTPPTASTRQSDLQAIAQKKQTKPKKSLSAQQPSFAKAKPAPSTQAALAKKLIELANAEQLRSVQVYEQALRAQLSVADFISALERDEVKARLTALRELAKADYDCRQGIASGCTVLRELSRDNRLTLAQQQIAFELLK